MGDWKSWSAGDVGAALQSFGFGQYAASFALHEIVGAHLPLITEGHLREMGVDSIGHRVKLCRRLRDVCSSPSSAPQPLIVACERGSDRRLAIPRVASSPTGTNNKLLNRPDFCLDVQCRAESGRHAKEPAVPDSHLAAKGDRAARVPPSKPATPPRRPLSSIAATGAKGPALAEAPEQREEAVRCEWCGRDYAPAAARRHRPVCEKLNGPRPRA